MDSTRLQEIKKRYNVVGSAEALNRALDVCLQVAATDLSVLIVGESGVGKEVLPRIIHDSSPRRRERYFAINCGSIPEGTIDSELFGHERGSFTGAVGESEGYFGTANGGTLFLDEVGELPMSTQARLLRVLETGEYIRVGGQEVRRTNVRIVAATNVNMRRAISEGRFREDLYYRLNTIPVQMPPLRERGGDVLLLFRLFSLQMQEKYRLPRLELTEDAKRLMLKYKWPGNVRQLKNITEQLSVLSTDCVITAETLLRYIPDDEESTAMTARSTTASGSSHSYEAERQLLFNFLFELQGSVQTLRSEVAELRKQLRQWGGEAAAAPSVRALLPAAPTLPAPDQGQQSHDNASDAPLPVGWQPTLRPREAIEEADAQEVSDDAPVTGESFSASETQERIPAPHSGESLNIRQNELEQIRKALDRNGGNRKKAAEELGISDRTLYRRLKEL